MPSAADFLTGYTTAQDRQMQAAMNIARQVAMQHQQEMAQQGLDLRRQGQQFDQEQDKARLDFQKQKSADDYQKAVDVQGLKNDAQNYKTDASRANATLRNLTNIALGADKLGRNPVETLHAMRGELLGSGGESPSVHPDQQHIDAAMQKGLEAIAQQGTRPTIAPGMFAQMGQPPAGPAPMAAPPVGSLMPPMPQQNAAPPMGVPGLGMAPAVQSKIALQGKQGALADARSQYLLGKNQREEERFPFLIDKDKIAVAAAQAGIDLKGKQAEKIDEFIKQILPLQAKQINANLERTKAITRQVNARTSTMNQINAIRANAQRLAEAAGGYIRTNGQIEVPGEDASDWLDNAKNAESYYARATRDYRTILKEYEKQNQDLQAYQELAKTSADPKSKAQALASAAALEDSVNHLAQLKDAQHETWMQAQQTAVAYRQFIQNTNLGRPPGFTGAAQQPQIPVFGNMPGTPPQGLPGFAAPTGSEMIPGMGRVNTYPPGKAPKSGGSGEPEDSPEFLKMAAKKIQQFMQGQKKGGGVVYQGNGFTVRKKQR